MAKRAPATDKPPTDKKVTRDDLEARFAGLQNGLRGKVESKRNTIVTAIGIGSVVLVIVVFLLGRRSGKRKTTLVEIRRV